MTDDIAHFKKLNKPLKKARKQLRRNNRDNNIPSEETKVYQKKQNVDCNK
ncbi:phage late control D family protein [Sesbania bispinosa]|nr:phage late control D family protein [Sesbania bispinosa]